MSSTNRGSERSASDYYVTPVDEIGKFLRAWHDDRPEVFAQIRHVLDPCAGGRIIDPHHIERMSYPVALRESADIFEPGVTIETMDIRGDSPADIVRDYLTTPPLEKPDLIISNPPFCLAQEFILKALQDVRLGGHVVFLLRLNFFGVTKEKPKLWANVGLPCRAYVHAKRMGFNRHRLDLAKKIRDGTDSIEYMHAVWTKGFKATETILKVI